MIRIFSILCIYWKIMWMLILIFSINERPNAQLAANIDSLRAELQKEIPDTTRVNNLNALSNSLIKSKDFPGTLATAREALFLAEKVNFPKGIAYANLYLGVVDVENKNYPSALEKYAISFALFRKLNDSLGLARYFHREGNLFFSQKLRREGIQRYKTASQLYEKLVITHPAESNFYRLNEVSRMCDAATFIPDYVLAREYCQQAYELAQKLDKKREQAEVLQDLGSIDYAQGNYSACVPNFLKSLDIFKDLGPINNYDKHQMAVTNSWLGTSYCRYLDDLTTGLQFYKVAIKLQEELGNYPLACEAMIEMGVDLFDHGYYPDALEQYLSALSLSEKINNKFFMFSAHRRLAELFRQNRNYDEAEKHYALAQLLNKQLGLKVEASQILQQLGIIQLNKGNKEAAIQIFNDMKALGEEIKDTHTVVIAYTNLLLLDVPIENYADLLPLFLSDLKKEENKGFSSLRMDVCRFVGIFYFKMQDYTHAEEYYIKSLQLAKKLENKRGMSTAYFGLKNIKAAQLEYKKALEYLELYVTYADSVSDEDNRRVLAEILTKYDTEKKEKEILSLQSEKQISDLELKVHQEALSRINLEKEKILTENLFNLQQVDFLANEKRLQQLEIEKNQIEIAIQKAETDNKQNQLVLLNKEGEIQKLEIKKQTLLKNSLLAGAGVFFFFGLFAYNNRITRQKLKLQTLRNKIATDLHDDVGSTLSSISIFSEMARQQSKEVIPMLDIIGDSSRKMLDAMADIVWTIQPENDQFDKIILRMRNFAFDLLGAKDIDFEFEADDLVAELKLPMDVRKNLYLIFKEATNNMVKYSEASTAMFRIKNDKGNLIMLIRDNGKGFNPDIKTQGNGLKNMKKRAKEIGGTLVIDSIQGSGTTIQLKVAV